jgi:hypothetical protein
MAYGSPNKMNKVSVLWGSHGPLAIGHSFDGKNSFFPNAVDPMEAFCIFVSPYP